MVLRTKKKEGGKERQGERENIGWKEERKGGKEERRQEENERCLCPIREQVRTYFQ